MLENEAKLYFLNGVLLLGTCWWYEINFTIPLLYHGLWDQLYYSTAIPWIVRSTLLFHYYTMDCEINFTIPLLYHGLWDQLYYSATIPWIVRSTLLSTTISCMDCKSKVTCPCRPLSWQLSERKLLSLSKGTRKQKPYKLISFLFGVSFLTHLSLFA